MKSLPRCDIAELYQTFAKFTPSQLMGLAPDMTSRYREAAADFIRENPERTDSMGFQGLNSGVVLYNLTRMRESSLYNEELDLDMMDELVDSFLFRDQCYVGDQDWLTLMSWKHPQLFHPLPCDYNFMEHDLESVPKKDDPQWRSYYTCEGKPKILHKIWSLDSSTNTL